MNCKILNIKIVIILVRWNWIKLNCIEEINIKQFNHIETYQLPSNLRVFKVLIKKSDLETNPDLANIKALQEKYTNVKFIYQE